MASGVFNVQGFYSALDSHRIAKGLSWKDVAKQSGVSQPTLSRLTKGHKPDVDGLALLLVWSGLDASDFIPQSEEREALAQISANLKADRNLSPESADALIDIIQIAYQRFRKV